MSAETLTTQSASDLLNLFKHLNSAVFWIRSPDYKTQIYVSEAYEKLWGRTCESLYQCPEYWDETLLPGDSTNNNNCYLSLKDRAAKGYTGASLFRIYRPSGEVAHIKDQSCMLFDAQQTPIAIVGVGESLMPQQWQELAKGQDTVLQEKEEISDFLKIIMQAYQLSCEIPSKMNKLDEMVNKQYLLEYEKQVIKTSRREWQTLYYLLQGYSAKETARLLNISPRTVETYLGTLRAKTGCRSKLALARTVRLLSD